MSTDLDTIHRQCQEALDGAKDASELEQVRLQYAGKKGVFRDLMQQLSSMPASDRSSFGANVNRLKNDFFKQLQEKNQTFDDERLEGILSEQSIDVTLPGSKCEVGHLHPLSIVKRRVESIFSDLGYSLHEGPEIEDDYHNFEALNIHELHPARAMHDTFYLNKTFSQGLRLLRTHTSSVQIRAMKKQNKPPIRAITMGRVYRCDSDITHTPMFHQMECILVDKGVSFSHLKATLTTFVQNFFEKKVPVRFRPSYFPFTEPSAEVDVGCVHCDGKGCRVCSNTGWLEILGSGLVHPKVLESVGIDSEEYSGFAFGVGLERLAMLKYQVDDLRLFFDNDIDFLKQFH